MSQCYAQMKISFPGLIFAQYKSINIIILLFLQSKERLAHIFNKPPLVAYRRPISLRDRLVGTKFKTVNNQLYQEAAKHAENQSAAGAKESTKPPRLPAVTTIRPLKYFTLLTASHHGLFTLLSVTSAIYST